MSGDPLLSSHSRGERTCCALVPVGGRYSFYIQMSEARSKCASPLTQDQSGDSRMATRAVIGQIDARSRVTLDYCTARQVNSVQRFLASLFTIFKTQHVILKIKVLLLLSSTTSGFVKLLKSNIVFYYI